MHLNIKSKLDITPEMMPYSTLWVAPESYPFDYFLGMAAAIGAVSYTHLTLPTICSV